MSPEHFTHSKVMCWVALDRAFRLAPEIAEPCPRGTRRAGNEKRPQIADFVEHRVLVGTSSAAATRDPPAMPGARFASLLMLSLVNYRGFGDAPSGVVASNQRMLGTIDAVSRELRHGAYVFRYLAEDDGLAGRCGGVLSELLVLAGGRARARGRVWTKRPQLMEALLRRSANDVGLYSEEIDPVSGAFLGNFPQALAHLSLIDAALAIVGKATLGSGPRPEKKRPPTTAIPLLGLTRGGVARDHVRVLAGGFVGTLNAMTTVDRAAAGDARRHADGPAVSAWDCAFTENRARRAKALRLPAATSRSAPAFAVACGALFGAIGRSVLAQLGARARSALQAVFNRDRARRAMLLPIVHPRMATADTAANEITLIEPPGFLMLNYGRNTFLVTLAAHIVHTARSSAGRIIVCTALTYMPRLALGRSPRRRPHP